MGACQNKEQLNDRSTDANSDMLGAAGLVLPGLLGIRRELTAMAAAGLGIIMSGAVAVTVMDGDPMMAIVPLTLGALALFVTWGRWPREVERGVRQAALRPASERQWREEWEARLDRMEAYIRLLQRPEGRARSDGSCAGC